MDIALGDVSDIVLQDEIYEEAYMYYKQKADRKKMADRPRPQQSTQANLSKEETHPQVNWVFKKPKKA